MRILLVFIALVGIGCAHSAYVPNTPHQVPLVAKKRWGGQVGFEFATAADVPLFADTSANPPVRSQGAVGSVYGAGSSLVAALGIFESIDIYLTHGLGLRWQFLGLEDANPWKATFFAGSIGGRNSESSTTAGGQTYKSSTRISGAEYGGSIGYQRTADLIFYSTLAQRQGRGETKIVQPANTFNYEDSFRLVSWVLGVQFGQSWYINAEIGASAVDWESAPKGDAYASAFGFGYKW